MSKVVVTECPDLSVTGTCAFNPAHFLNWWTTNASSIKLLVNALPAYRCDLAGREFTETNAVAENLFEGWLHSKESDADFFTDTLQEYSADTKKLLKMLHSKVFSRDQGAAPEPARILVAGDVQSGKTGAYTELIKALLAVRAEKSFPERYIFLVLGGVHNKLRRQTQERLSAELNEANGELVWLTTKEGDLVAPRALSAIAGEGTASYIAVVKKVTSRLKAAANVFAKLADGNGLAVVIIDDECDQITPDTRTKEKRNSRRMARLLWGEKASSGGWSMPEKFSKNGLVYMGYTATPYSNVFLDEERSMSMYPSTYMHALTPGKGYMGYDHYWPQSDTPGKSRSMDVFRVPDGEIAGRRCGPDSGKFKVSETALEDALLWFLIAACIKRERLGVGKIAVDDRHTSMLVHAHVKVVDHVRMRDAVNTYMHKLTDDWLNGSRVDIEKKLLSVFDKAKGTEDRPASITDESNAEVESLLQKHLTKVLSNLTVVCDNSRSKHRLEYPDDREADTKDTIVEVIAVGGYTLSRGITLRGLVSSYVSRITKVVYDTYLQLCRWFGYRHGYGDLTRLWVTGSVSDTYADIARVDRQFKSAITSAGLDPEGPYGHGQIYLGTVAGALPSSTLDSLIRSTAFKDNTPHGNRLFSPTQGWADTDVDHLLASRRTGKDVADFLKKYNGPDPDRNCIEQLVNFIRENEDLSDCAWDVQKPVYHKDSTARFKRGVDSPPKLLNTADWYIKTPTDREWRAVKDCPLLLVAPALIYPPAQTPDASPRHDWIVAVIFDKRYGPAEAYMNYSIKLREDQQEEFVDEDDKRDRT